MMNDYTIVYKHLDLPEEDLPRLTDDERADVARWLRAAAESGGLTLRQEARDLALQIADRLDAATEPAPGLQAGPDAASGVAQRPEPDARDVEACASCGRPTTHRIVLAGVPTPACLRHTNHWRTPDWLAARDAAMRAQGAADALREAADEIDREAAEAAARRRVADVRCLACDLRYEERDQYGCHEPGRPHTYDPTDLTEVGRVVVEPTYDGDRLRDRARRIAGQDGGGRDG